MFNAPETIALLEAFDCGVDDLAAKSRELILNLLRYTPHPFSREQYQPGHITCTALVFDPEGDSILLMLHHRHQRWLLPGGHVEESDPDLASSARREAIEETNVMLPDTTPGELAGMDVHGIAGKKREPYHLHHDLVFAFRSAGRPIAATKEAPRVEWCPLDRLESRGVPENVLRSARRIRSHATLL